MRIINSWEVDYYGIDGIFFEGLILFFILGRGVCYIFEIYDCEKNGSILFVNLFMRNYILDNKLNRYVVFDKRNCGN